MRRSRGCYCKTVRDRAEDAHSERRGECPVTLRMHALPALFVKMADMLPTCQHIRHDVPPLPPPGLPMPHQILGSDFQQEGFKPNPDLDSGLFCLVPLCIICLGIYSSSFPPLPPLPPRPFPILYKKSGTYVTIWGKVTAGCRRRKSWLDSVSRN